MRGAVGGICKYRGLIFCNNTEVFKLKLESLIFYYSVFCYSLVKPPWVFIFPVITYKSVGRLENLLGSTLFYGLLFFLGCLFGKKNRMGNRLFFFLCSFTYICHIFNSWTGFTKKPNSKKLTTVFSFPNPKSRRKKKTVKSALGKVGRRSYVITWKK